MVDLYLVTGFLGAGKTTFLKNFLRFLSPRKVRVIVNEFGKVGVDGSLLAELHGELDEIVGGSIFCVCRMDQFEKALDAALEAKPEIVIVEASGLSDPVGVRKLLSGERYRELRYRGAICIVDAVRFEKVFSTARACARQLSVSSLVLVNKADLAGDEQVAKVSGLIRERYPSANIKPTVHGQFDPAWLEELDEADSGEEPDSRQDITLQRMCVSVGEAMTPEQLEHFIQLFVEDTFRVKGFIRLGGELYLADCVGSYVKIIPWEGKPPDETGLLIALAGKGMPLRKSIRSAVALYPGLVELVE